MSCDREYILGARLAGLLINVGTSCLHQIFTDGFKKKLESFSPAIENLEHLPTFLNHASIKKTLFDYYKPRVKDKKPLLRKEQWKLLYPDSGDASSQEFDITLLIFLIRNLKLVDAPTGGWYCEPSDDDTSVGVNINRLCTMRNELYGHITTTACTREQHKHLSKELKKILRSLNAVPASIDEWDTKFGNDNENRIIEMDATNQELINLVQLDLHDIQILQQNLISTVETLFGGAVNEQKQILIAALDDLRNDLAESMPSKVLEICTTVQRTFASEVAIHFKDLVKGDGYFDAILLEIKKNHDKNTEFQLELQKGVNSVIEGQKTHQDTLEKLLSEIKCDTQIRERNEMLQPGLLFDDKDWKMLKDPFKILIITSAMQQTEKDTLFKELGDAVGLCPWQIVLDLDRCSKSPNDLFDFTTERLRKHIIVQVESYETIRLTKDQDKEAVVKGEKVLWIQANGSETLNCESCLEHFGKSISKIEPVFDDILSRLPGKRAILCIVMLLTDIKEELNAVKKIGQMIENLYDCQNNKIDIATSKFFIFVEPEIVKPSDILKIAPNSQYIEWKRFEVKLHLVVQFFCEWYGRKSDQIYNIPGAVASFCLSEEDYTELQPVMELYYKDIGKINSDTMSDKEFNTKVNEIKYRYLKGNPITPDALYLHDNVERMYVDRKCMKNIKSEIQQELKRRNDLSATNASRKGIYLIEHYNSGGGTTCGRSLLFGLREEYPCIEIKQFGLQLLKWLKIIYLKAQLPLLLLIDNLDCQTLEVIMLERFLENNKVKTLVIYIKRTVEVMCPSGNLDSEVEEPGLPSSGLDSEERKIDKKFVLNSHLTAIEDKHAFKKLYNSNKQKAFKLKVFMFGLYKFLGEYEKLEPLIECCIKSANINQLKLMRAILIESKYVHTGIHPDVARNFLNDYHEDLERVLGPIADFLVFNNMRLKTASDCFVNVFLRKLIPNDTGEQLELFLEDSLTVSKKDSDRKMNSFDLVCSLFIRGRKIDRHWWTEFVEDLEKKHDKFFIKIITEKFLKVFDGIVTRCPHLRTFLARYLMHKVNDHEDAIKQIRLSLGVSDAVGICETSVTDMVLLSAYGNLHRDMMKHKMKEDIAKNKEDPEIMQMKEIFYFASESVKAYAKAQESTKTSLYDMKDMYFAHSFYGEAITRYALLSHIFTYKCSGNHPLFIEYISSNSQIQLVKESLRRAFEILQNLEYLIALGCIELDAETPQKVIKIKFDLLQLSTDEKHSMKEMLSSISDIIPCDFGYFMLNHRGKGNAPRLWKDFANEDLKFIIEMISKRMPYPDRMLPFNYRDIITAMIYIRQLKSNDNMKYNLCWACECAAEWVKHASKNFEAHFILGFLKLLKALSEDNTEAVNDSKQSLETCKKVCKDYPCMPAYCHFRYNIGCGQGLEKAVPYDKAIAKPLLMKFTGRKINDNLVSVRCGELENAFTAKVLKSDNNSTIDGSSWSVIPNHRRITFNLAIALDRITAINLDLSDLNE